MWIFSRARKRHEQVMRAFDDHGAALTQLRKTISDDLVLMKSMQETVARCMDVLESNRGHDVQVGSAGTIPHLNEAHTNLGR